MAKEEAIVAQGVVSEALRDGFFRVKLDDQDHTVLCGIAGKLRKHYIRITPGDKVTVEISPYDFKRGRITYRER